MGPAVFTELAQPAYARDPDDDGAHPVSALPPAAQLALPVLELVAADEGAHPNPWTEPLEINTVAERRARMWHQLRVACEKVTNAR
ncbi:unnamed protein product, partial [Closterium sp. Naga37s-1]